MLPPSPPLSPRRLKRKSPDAPLQSGEAESANPNKRPRQEASPPTGQHHVRSSSTVSVTHRTSEDATRNHANTTHIIDSAPAGTPKKEEGELDEIPAISLPRPAAHRPTRPRRRPFGDDQIRALAESYQHRARELKRSGEKRRDTGAPRIVKRNLYSLLEQTDAAVHFAYGFWALGNSRNALGSWESIDSYIHQVRMAWERLGSDLKDETRRGKVRIFLGLL